MTVQYIASKANAKSHFFLVFCYIVDNTMVTVSCCVLLAGGLSKALAV